MQNQSTTVRVSTTTRDAVQALAIDDGVTMDEEIRRLARTERQRRMGAALAAAEHDEADDPWLTLGGETVSRHASR